MNLNSLVVVGSHHKKSFGDSMGFMSGQPRASPTIRSRMDEVAELQPSRRSRLRVYKLHVSYVSMRKQLLNLERGLRQYPFEDILPRSFVPVILSKPFSDHEILGKSVLEKDPPRVYSVRVPEFEEGDTGADRRQQAATIDRLTTASVKNSNFIVFEDPPFKRCSFLWLVVLFFLLVHLPCLLFECTGYRWVMGQPFSLDKFVGLDLSVMLLGIVIDVFAFCALFGVWIRVVSWYICLSVAFFMFNLILVEKYITLCRLGIEIVLICLMFHVRSQMSYQWFTTNTLE